MNVLNTLYHKNIQEMRQTKFGDQKCGGRLMVIEVVPKVTFNYCNYARVRTASGG